VRTESTPDRWFRRSLGLLAAIGLAGLGATLIGPVGAVLGVAAGLAGALLVERRAERRWSRRRLLLATPFPPRWRRLLLERCDPYARLPDAWRRRFEDDLRLFVDETRVTGIDVQVDDELRLLVACSAVCLSVGWPDYEWDQLAEVLLYPKDFGRDYSLSDSELSGEAHAWGTLILSAPALRLSFADPEDGFHVGIHEFTHLLDAERTHFDGIPVGLALDRHREWLELMEREMLSLRRGRSVLDPYGSEEPVEFLAVAVEAFFEIPLLLRDRHGELYRALSGYFGQDPATWDEQRGRSACVSTWR
jgi:Mlc titration factor MtfA (ptsG expression regulator)